LKVFDIVVFREGSELGHELLLDIVLQLDEILSKLSDSFSELEVSHLIIIEIIEERLLIVNDFFFNFALGLGGFGVKFSLDGCISGSQFFSRICGLMVNKSHPASSMVCSMVLKLAPITTVLYPTFLR